MQRLTNHQMFEMIEMQDALNRVVNPDWLTANYPWMRAARVECAELTDHLGWKWWKKQEPNFPQAHIELVDIWHFMLSSALVGVKGNKVDAVASMVGGLQFPHDAVLDLLGKKFAIAGAKLHDQVDLLSAFASAGYVMPALFEAIMANTGLSWAELRRIYIGKNVLNQFRQAHGYKEGTYEKTWHGVEDNVRLEQIMETQPAITVDELRAELWRVYDTVPMAADAQPLREAA